MASMVAKKQSSSHQRIEEALENTGHVDGKKIIAVLLYMVGFDFTAKGKTYSPLRLCILSGLG